MSTPIPVRNRLDVLRALRSAKSLTEAASAVSFTVTELRDYANANHMGAAYARVERDGGFFKHPGFIDMANQPLFGGAIVVVKRAANESGNAAWVLRWTACQHTATRQGIQIRAASRKGEPLRCPVCRRARA